MLAQGLLQLPILELKLLALLREALHLGLWRTLLAFEIALGRGRAGPGIRRARGRQARGKTGAKQQRSHSRRPKHAEPALQGRRLLYVRHNNVFSARGRSFYRDVVSRLVIPRHPGADGLEFYLGALANCERKSSKRRRCSSKDIYCSASSFSNASIDFCWTYRRFSCSRMVRATSFSRSSIARRRFASATISSCRLRFCTNN